MRVNILVELNGSRQTLNNRFYLDHFNFCIWIPIMVAFARPWLLVDGHGCFCTAMVASGRSWLLVDGHGCHGCSGVLTRRGMHGLWTPRIAQKSLQSNDIMGVRVSFWIQDIFPTKHLRCWDANHIPNHQFLAISKQKGERYHSLGFH